MPGETVAVIDPGEEELSPGSLKHLGFGLHEGSRLRLRGTDQKIAGPGFHRKRAKDNQQNEIISHDVIPWQGAAFGKVPHSISVHQHHLIIYARAINEQT